MHRYLQHDINSQTLALKYIQIQINGDSIVLTYSKIVVNGKESGSETVAETNVRESWVVSQYHWVPGDVEIIIYIDTHLFNIILPPALHSLFAEKENA